MLGSIIRKLKRKTKILLGKEVNQPIQVKYLTQRYGSTYGGWNIYPKDITSSSIIYSAGIGEDISFDLALIKQFGVTIYGFDPTPGSIKWIESQPLPKGFIMHPYGIANSDRETLFYPPENPTYISHTIFHKPTTQHKAFKVPLFCLSTIMKKLGHTSIDVLKMDIEAAEYEVIEDIVSSEIPIKQLLVEFHHRFPGVGIEKTEKAIKQLNKAGYKIFSISESGQEYSFIKI